MKKYKLGEIASIYNGSTPSTADKDNYDGDIVWATPKDLSDQQSKWFYKGARNITKKGFDSCSTQIIPANNILMSSRAPIGLFAINKVDCCTNQGFKNIVLDKSITDVDFMYYFLKYHVKEIEALGTGTTFKEVSKKSFESYEIEIPNLNIQKRIASILSALDQKIYLNRSINRDLEALAKQLYDYWFVQFDFPDENGRPYKSSGGKMVWNDDLKREIPSSWDVKSIADIAEVYNGATPSTTDEENYGGDVVWITPKDLSTQQQKFIYHGERNISHKGYESCSTHLLPSNTVLMSSRAPIGLLAIAKTELCTNQGFKSFVPRNDNEATYLYYYIQTHIRQIEQLGTGTTFKEVSREDVLKFPILKPNNGLLDTWEVRISAINKKQLEIQKENENLTKLRNELLPLLMNGQVTVNPDLSVY